MLRSRSDFGPFQLRVRALAPFPGVPLAYTVHLFSTIFIPTVRYVLKQAFIVLAILFSLDLFNVANAKKKRFALGKLSI